MLKYLSVLVLTILIVSCKKQETRDLDFVVYNDIIEELIDKDIYFENLDEYILRTQQKDSLSFDKQSFDEIYEIYNKNKKEKEILNVFINNKLYPLDEFDNLSIMPIKEIIEDIGSYNDLNKSKLSFSPVQKINLPEKLNYSSFEQATIGFFKFSRVYFNTDMNKAFFVYEYNCEEEYCYKKSLIYVEKDNEKWQITKYITLVVS
jgi:hypothetical protein